MAKTNYNKMAKKAEDTAPVMEASSLDVEQVVEETVEPEVEITEAPVPEYKTGIVTGCTKLNVRIEPKATAKIIGTLDAGVSVTIYDEIGEFYKVGPTNEYCMKKYISVK